MFLSLSHHLDFGSNLQQLLLCICWQFQPAGCGDTGLSCLLTALITIWDGDGVCGTAQACCIGRWILLISSLLESALNVL